MDILLTDGNQRSTLAAVRGLGEAGFTVAVGEGTPSSLAGSSRYCRSQVVYPPPATDPRGFQGFLRQEARRSGCRMLLPMTDISCFLASQIGDELRAQGVLLPLPSHEVVARVQDKQYVQQVAERLGIACLPNLLPRGPVLEDLAHGLPYPLAVKPRYSHYLGEDGWAAGRVHFAFTPADLLATYRSLDEQIPKPVVQERIQGEGRGVFLLVWDGYLKAAFCHRRLRERPPWGGVSVLSESIAPDSALILDSYRLLQALGWQGPAMVEYKLDRTGRPVLMEINGRFWGSLQLALDAGMNFPALLYRLAGGEDVPDQFNYRVGVKCRWLLGDLDHLLLRFVQRSESALLGRKSTVRAVLDFMKFHQPGLRYESPRRGDWKPFWFECRQYLRKRMAGSRKRQDLAPEAQASKPRRLQEHATPVAAAGRLKTIEGELQ